MGGGWVGYVYVLAGCGAVFAVLAGSTLLLYVVARVRSRRRPDPAVSVTPVGSQLPKSGLDERSDLA